jgi:hypothetical protein
MHKFQPNTNSQFVRFTAKPMIDYGFTSNVPWTLIWVDESSGEEQLINLGNPSYTLDYFQFIVNLQLSAKNNENFLKMYVFQKPFDGTITLANYKTYLHYTLIYYGKAFVTNDTSSTYTQNGSGAPANPYENFVSPLSDNTFEIL